MKITKAQLRSLVKAVLLEGKPFSSKGGLAGLFRQEQTPFERKTNKRSPAYDFDDFEDDFENTEQIIPYSEDYEDYNASHQVMKSPINRIQSIHMDTQNPYIPGETYKDTQRRVMKKADKLSSNVEIELQKKRKAKKEKLLQNKRERDLKISHIRKMNLRKVEPTGVLDDFVSDYNEDEIQSLGRMDFNDKTLPMREFLFKVYSSDDTVY